MLRSLLVKASLLVKVTMKGLEKDILVEMGGIELIPKTLSNKALSKINK